MSKYTKHHHLYASDDVLFIYGWRWLIRWSITAKTIGVNSLLKTSEIKGIMNNLTR
jgi:hypothetical protein